MFDVIGSVVISRSCCCLPNDERPSLDFFPRTAPAYGAKSDAIFLLVSTVETCRHIHGLEQKLDKPPIFENPPGRPDRGPKRERMLTLFIVSTHFTTSSSQAAGCKSNTNISTEHTVDTDMLVGH